MQPARAALRSDGARHGRTASCRALETGAGNPQQPGPDRTGRSRLQADAPRLVATCSLRAPGAGVSDSEVTLPAPAAARRDATRQRVRLPARRRSTPAYRVVELPPPVSQPVSASCGRLAYRRWKRRQAPAREGLGPVATAGRTGAGRSPLVCRLLAIRSARSGRCGGRGWRGDPATARDSAAPRPAPAARARTRSCHACAAATLGLAGLGRVDQRQQHSQVVELPPPVGGRIGSRRATVVRQAGLCHTVRHGRRGAGAGAGKLGPVAAWTAASTAVAPCGVEMINFTQCVQGGRRIPRGAGRSGCRRHARQIVGRRATLNGSMAAASAAVFRCWGRSGADYQGPGTCRGDRSAGEPRRMRQPIATDSSASTAPAAEHQPRGRFMRDPRAGVGLWSSPAACPASPARAALTTASPTPWGWRRWWRLPALLRAP